MKLFKRFISAAAVALSLTLAMPFGVFAAQTSSYLVNQNFESNNVGDTVFNSVKSVVSTDIKDKGTFTSGSISVVSVNNNKALKYHKTMSASNVAHYTDISSGNIKNGTDFVIEFTFWYEGDVSSYTWGGELVGARKTKDGTPSGSPDMKPLITIKSGTLVTSSGAEITKLYPNVPYKIAIAVHDGNAKFDVYLNEVKKVKDQEYAANTKSDFTSIRMLNITGLKKSTEDDYTTVVNDFPIFYMDDVKLYYESIPECAGGVASASPKANSGNNGGNTGGGNTDGATDDIGGGAIITPPVVDNTDKLVQDATTKGPNLNDLIQNIQSGNSFNFTAPSETASSAELPSSPVAEDSKDIVIAVAFCGAAVIIIGGSLFLTKKPKKKDNE